MPQQFTRPSIARPDLIANPKNECKDDASQNVALKSTPIASILLILVPPPPSITPAYIPGRIHRNHKGRPVFSNGYGTSLQLVKRIRFHPLHPRRPSQYTESPTLHSSSYPTLAIKTLCIADNCCRTNSTTSSKGSAPHTSKGSEDVPSTTLSTGNRAKQEPEGRRKGRKERDGDGKSEAHQYTHVDEFLCVPQGSVSNDS